MVKWRAEALMLGASSDTLSRRAGLPPVGEDVSPHVLPGQARAGGLAGISTDFRDLDTITL
jgi:hypothetical protein